MAEKYKYDIAISFAEEDRNAALALALALEMKGFNKVYYYPEKQGVDWGEDLEKLLTKIYFEEARYAVVLLSNHYFDAQKHYTRIEFTAIEKRMKADASFIYMLPVILSTNFSFKKYPQLARLKCQIWNYNPKDIAEYLIQLFGKRLTRDKEKAAPQNVIYSTGDDALFIVGTKIRNFNKNQFPKNGNR
jgi:hypothetical protein